MASEGVIASQDEFGFRSIAFLTQVWIVSENFIHMGQFFFNKVFPDNEHQENHTDFLFPDTLLIY